MGRKRDLDWELLKYPKHDSFLRFITDLNRLYLDNPAMYREDYSEESFRWIDCHREDQCVYVFERSCQSQRLVFLFNFSDAKCEYTLNVADAGEMRLLLDTDWDIYNGQGKANSLLIKSADGNFTVPLVAFSGRCYQVRNTANEGL